jgi:hypothetical protein
MTTYMVSYDLIAPGKNYDQLIAHLNSYGTHFHVLKSQWLIVTDKSAAEVRDDCRKFLDGNDKILVTVARAPGAWLNLGETDWLQKYLV